MKHRGRYGSVENGEELVTIKFNGESVVTQLACLKYLSVSGLEKFNRI